MFSLDKLGARPGLLIAALALVLATAGTATAAKLITGKQVKNGTIKSADVGNSSLTGKDIKNRSLTGTDVKDGSLGAVDLSPAALAALKGQPGAPGAKGEPGPAGTPNGYTKDEANAAFLGKSEKAADAEDLDGVDGDDYTRGDARIAYGTAARTENSPAVQLVSIPDIGRVRALCGPGGAKTLFLDNSSGGTVELSVANQFAGGDPVIAAGTVASGESEAIAGGVANLQSTLQVLRPGNGDLAPQDFATVIITATDDGSDCRFFAHVVSSEFDGLQIALP